MSDIETDDKLRLRKLSEAISIGDVRLYRDDGTFVIEYRDSGTRKCMADGPTLDAAIDGMDLEV